MHRTGDQIAIAGSYQHHALYHGRAPQRWWHALKLETAAQLAGPLQGKQLLDLGCGSGVLLDFIRDFDGYSGVDANEEAIAFANKTYSRPAVVFQQALFEHALHALQPKSIDLCFFLETIEHIDRQQAVELMQQLQTRLKPGGALILTTPNKRSLWPLIETLLDASGLVPTLDGSQHAYLYHSRELKELLLQSGFRQVDVVSFNGIAPWLPFLPDNMIRQLHRWELKQSFFFGSLLGLKATA